MICCSCGKEIDINYGREYWNGIYCKKCADEMLSTPEYIKIYKRIIADLQAENAALRERLEKAVLNRRIYYLASIWNDATLTRRKEARCRTVDYVCDKFVECDGLTLNWDEIYFTREAAEARLAELKGETND